MGMSELQDWLLQNSGFNRQLHEVIVDSVVQQFSRLKPIKNSEKHDWEYLLMCASILGTSDRGDCQDASLRIAQFCLNSDSTSENQKDASAVILDSMANKPTIKLAEERGLIPSDVYNRLPFTLKLDWIRRSVQYSIALSGEKTISANRFQNNFWNSIKENDWVSVSAPTSAGKSFIIERYLVEFIRKNPQSTIAYIVPTRALIYQVENDLSTILTSEKISNVSVSSLPLQDSLEDGKGNVFVFTQERLHILLAAFDYQLKIDLLVVDEAHKLGDGPRGVLLQQAIESVVSWNKKAKVIFASPLTKNPELMLQDAPENIDTKPLISEDTMVNQNLLWANQLPLVSTRWQLELCLAGEVREIGRFDLCNRPTQKAKILPFVAYALGSRYGGNLIYANIPSDAERAAIILYDLLDSEQIGGVDPEISDLIELIKKTIHKDYLLAKVLERRIAFHYGNMPLLIRAEIERLFNENKIKYLVCTSTLIEGVNMPCKNIFVRGPRKGKKLPMSKSDFWNLAGRAGRWRREFQGNIICVDTRDSSVWKDGVPLRRERYSIKRATDEVLHCPEKLLSFIQNGAPREEIIKSPELESIFSFLVSSYLVSGSIKDRPWVQRYPTNFIADLEGLLTEVCQNLKTPHSVIQRNPGISPIAMDSLLDYFFNRNKDVNDLIPALPESGDAYKSYLRVLFRINKHFAPLFGPSARVRQLTLIILNWMRGFTLARLISGRIKHYSKTQSVNLATQIRSTMVDVEQYARFQAPRLISCYLDLLRFFLKEQGQEDLLQDLPEVNVWLEFGVSQKTQISLIGLGLSRTTAIELSVIIANNNLTEQECLEWIHAHEWVAKEMPNLVKREIERFLLSRNL